MKKKYENLMTEHERRVNDKDIEAYENYDTSNIYGKLRHIIRSSCVALHSLNRAARSCTLFDWDKLGWSSISDVAFPDY